MDAPPAAFDAVDRRRIRIALSLVAATVAGGLGLVLGAAYLEVCPVCDDMRALGLLGIAPAWAAAMAVAAAQWAWRRSFGSGVAGAFLLGWLAFHFVLPGMVVVYTPAWWMADAVGWTAWFLLYWGTVGAAMAGAVVGAARWLDRTM